MSTSLTYLITGANRGLGLGLVSMLLQRPGTTVIATVRNKTTTDCTDLKALPLAKGSKSLIESLEVAEQSSFHALKETLDNLNVKNIDVVIANAGTGLQFQSCAETEISSLLENFTINTLAPILLYQTLRPLILASPTPKFIVISSSLGSITGISDMVGAPILAYGVSKAGVNFFVRQLHFEEKELVTLSVHPGWVKTGNGQSFADAVGVEAPPMNVEESVRGVMGLIDEAKKDTTSGTFLAWDERVLGY